MRPAKPLSVLALAAILLMAIPMYAAAQAELQTWLDPKLGKLMPHAEYGLTYYPAEQVGGQGTDLRRIDHSFSLSVPLFQDSLNEWSLAANVGLQDIDTRAILPDTRERLPSELWDVRIGGSYRHQFENNWIGGASLTVGSPRDKPFNSVDEVVLRAMGMLRVPHGERNAWLFSLIYSKDQEFLGGAPIARTKMIGSSPMRSGSRPAHGSTCGTWASGSRAVMPSTVSTSRASTTPTATTTESPSAPGRSWPAR